MYLLDTNICIDFVDGRNENARRRVRQSFPKGLAISSITAGELLVGVRGSTEPEKDMQRIEKFIRVVRCHDFDEAAARAYAIIARQIGMQRRSFDRLIAAHALALGLILVTNNAKHFSEVPGLNVENWTLPL